MASDSSHIRISSRVFRLCRTAIRELARHGELLISLNHSNGSPSKLGLMTAPKSDLRFGSKRLGSRFRTPFMDHPSSLKLPTSWPACKGVGRSWMEDKSEGYLPPRESTKHQSTRHPLMSRIRVRGTIAFITTQAHHQRTSPRPREITTREKPPIQSQIKFSETSIATRA